MLDLRGSGYKVFALNRWVAHNNFCLHPQSLLSILQNLSQIQEYATVLDYQRP